MRRRRSGNATIRSDAAQSVFPSSFLPRACQTPDRRLYDARWARERGRVSGVTQRPCPKRPAGEPCRAVRRRLLCGQRAVLPGHRQESVVDIVSAALCTSCALLPPALATRHAAVVIMILSMSCANPYWRRASRPHALCPVTPTVLSLRPPSLVDIVLPPYLSTQLLQRENPDG